MRSKLEFVMRKILIPLLLAGVLTPAAAFAGPDSQGDRSQVERGERGERAETSKERSQRSERAVRTERPVRAADSERGQRVERDERAQRVERNERAIDTRNAAPTDSVKRSVRVEGDVQQVETTQPTQPIQQSRGGLVEGFRSLAREDQADRSGDDDWKHDRDWDHRHWSGDWRRDDRYDWHKHRSHHKSLYRLGRYYDPYGWGYRRFSIGFSLWPSYYGSSFWMNDPWQYRLPPAYGPYRWVRYYNDALLVNIYTGQVVDVIYSFFW
jgi:hypothetical protein